MHRAIYFDGWYPHTWCQHPSMPPRRLAMLDDLADMRATTLVWAGLGGGSISLPYLEEEAYGPIPARFRQYGYVTDAEFIAHARERGVELFAIVFEAQAWELPAEVGAEGEVFAQTELRGAGPRTWVGLREFSQGTGPASWGPLEAYFPGGLANSAGEPVTDLFHEVASKDLDGRPYHTHWVEIGEREQACHYGDRTNPVWRAYLKKVIEIQVDAGARAIQLDETETPLGALRYGGCFCRDCMTAFREYLQALPAEDRPAELDGVDLTTFDYGAWLRARGHKAGENPRGLPLYQHLSRCLQLTIPRTFADLADHARALGGARGAEVTVAGNFFDCAPMYDPFVDLVDTLVTEMKETRYQQPWWFRHAVGMARGKPVVAVENPYGGGIMERLVADLERGRGMDRFRTTILEAAAMGATMALPYGSWLGNEIKHSYSVPRHLAVETGQYLEGIDSLLSAASPHRTAVLWSVASLMRNWVDGDQNNEGDRWYPPIEMPDLPPASYWETVEHLSRSSCTFDVVPLPDEGLRPNDVTATTLARYEVVVLPDVWAVSRLQHEELVAYLDAGGRVVVHGAYGTQLPVGWAEALLEHPRTLTVTAVAEVAAHVTRDVELDLGPRGAVSLQTLPVGGVAVHLVSYEYDDAADAALARRDVPVGVPMAVAASAGV
ncbi:MAG: hypothetical protein M3116_06730, partial [Actinomycetota bacterium]|nr:hypothetical protein [Actinomycetota bacterium]